MVVAQLFLDQNVDARWHEKKSPSTEGLFILIELIKIKALAEGSQAYRVYQETTHKRAKETPSTTLSLLLTQKPLPPPRVELPLPENKKLTREAVRPDLPAR